MLDRIPSRMVVIGGGAIGCEFASTFADLGSKVTILEGLPKILPGLDNDVANVVVRAFKKRGIDIHTGVMVTGHTPSEDGGTTVHFGDGEHARGRRRRRLGRPPPVRRPARARRHGRRGRPAGLRRGRRALPHRRAGRLRPRRPHRHARSWPTSASPRRIVVVKDMLGEDPIPVVYDRVPWAIYCHPEVAFAGHSRGGGRRPRLRRRRRQAPVPGQQPGPDHRRDRRPGEGHRREGRRRHAPARSSACTWWARGSPSSSARATWP